MSEAEAEAEAKMKARYGALPNQKNLLERRMKGDVGAKERKYFDSADWAKSLQQPMRSASEDTSPPLPHPPQSAPSPPGPVADAIEAPPGISR